MARAAQAEAVECPRCGYDVSGVMSLWKSECPVEGRCSECGYEFQWRHLLGPNLGVPKWFFETAHRKKIRAAISTSVRTLAPWHFWKRVPLHAPMEFARQRAMVIGGSVLLYLFGVFALSIMECAAALAGVGKYGSGWRGPVPPFASRMHDFVHDALASSAAWPLKGHYSDLESPLGGILLWIMITLALVPACFFAVSETLKRERVRIIHIVRASVLGWCSILIVASLCLGIVCVMSFMDWPYPLSWRAMPPLVHWGIDFGWVVLGCAIAMGAWWWWAVCRDYLQIRHPFWTAMSLQLMAMLAALLVLFPIIPHSTWVWLLRL